MPRFFEGRLWDINLGTGDGLAASPAVAEAVTAAARQVPGYTSILNGRFKGGYITRHYGRPADRIEALQLELSQIVYMEEEPPFRFRDDRAAEIRPALRRILEAMLAAGAEQHREVSAAV